MEQPDREFLIGNPVLARIRHISRDRIFVIPATPADSQSHERRHILQAGGREATPEWRDMARCTQPAEEGRHDRNPGRSPPEFNACLLLLSDVGSRL